MARILLYCATFLLLVPLTVDATVVWRTGDTVNVSDEQVVEGNFYALGSDVDTSGIVQGDVYVLADSFTAIGLVTEDVVVVADNVHIHATITEDVRVVGRTVEISGSIGGDLVVVGGYLDVLPSATVSGDILFFGQQLELEGDVAGAVYGTAQSTRIDGQVEGMVQMTVETLTLGDKAEILSDITYTSAAEIERAQSAVVVGSVVRNAPADQATTVPLQELAITFIVVLFAALLLQLFLRSRLADLIKITAANTGLSTFIGGAILLTIPILLSLVFVSLVSSPVGILAVLMGILILLLTMFGVALAVALLPVVVGAYLQFLINKQFSVNVASTVSGGVVLFAMSLIPLIGALVFVVFLLATFGGLCRALFRFVQQST